MRFLSPRTVMMSRHSVLLLLCLFVILSRCLIRAAQFPPYDYGPDTERLAKRQNPQLSLQVGSLERDNGRLPLRLEVRDLQATQPEKWTLYILALSWLQYLDQSDPLSWYQLTGIHGVPYLSWGGVNPTPGNENSGYCTHGSQLFPTWHRPYLVLFEQTIVSHAKSIAEMWPAGANRTRYRAAAADLKIPYWDWAATPSDGQSVLPFSIGGLPYVDINGPNGLQRIANPLYTYQFKPLDADVFMNLQPWDLWKTTIRSPTSMDGAAQSNDSNVMATLDANFKSFQSRLYNLLSYYKDYGAFSNEGWLNGPPNSSYDSIESLHDVIHNLSGGLQGHMSYIPFSAFDPIFFLHHAMVDRVLAIWQVLNPDSWVTPSLSPMSSYTISKGQIIDSGTPLTPFYANVTTGTFWTSDTVRDPTIFGYTYPEIAQYSFGVSRQQSGAKAKVMTSINRLYGSSSPARLAIGSRHHGRHTSQALSSTDGLSPPSARSGSKVLSRPGPPIGSVIVENRFREWVANIRVDRHALRDSFFIHLFLGDVPSDPRSWSLATQLVGTMSVFSMPAVPDIMGGTSHISGTVPLTSDLVEKITVGIIPTLDPSVVEPLLADSLHVRILKTDGTVVNPQTIPSLSIKIISSNVLAPTSEGELPQWGVTDYHLTIV